jgi:hypothetical protein
MSAATLAPASATAPSTESPEEKVHRLGRELAEALNWYLDGCFSMHIWPSEERDKPFNFIAIQEPRVRHLH